MNNLSSSVPNATSTEPSIKTEQHETIVLTAKKKVETKKEKGLLKKYHCFTCGKIFRKKTTLLQHDRTHTDYRPYGCDVCGKRFRQQCHLTQHLLIHTDEKPFGCEYCDRRFRQRANKNAHMRFHSDELPFACAFCVKLFRKKKDLAIHVSVHLREVLKEKRKKAEMKAFDVSVNSFLGDDNSNQNDIQIKDEESEEGLLFKPSSSESDSELLSKQNNGMQVDTMADKDVEKENKQIKEEPNTEEKLSPKEKKLNMKKKTKKRKATNEKKMTKKDDSKSSNENENENENPTSSLHFQQQQNEPTKSPLKNDTEQNSNGTIKLSITSLRERMSAKISKPTQNTDPNSNRSTEEEKVTKNNPSENFLKPIEETIIKQEKAENEIPEPKPIIRLKRVSDLMPKASNNTPPQNQKRIPKAVRRPPPLPGYNQGAIRRHMRLKNIPPRPVMKITSTPTGITLSWNLDLNDVEPILKYHIYGYSHIEDDDVPISTSWKKIGEVFPLPLPIACALTTFKTGHRYFFAIRAIDIYNRHGPFSLPGSLLQVT